MDARLDLPQVRYGLSVLLLEVFCTPGIDSICRQVSRQLMRNELARFYHHRARKCIPPRKITPRDTVGLPGSGMDEIEFHRPLEHPHPLGSGGKVSCIPTLRRFTFWRWGLFCLIHAKMAGLETPYTSRATCARADPLFG